MNDTFCKKAVLQNFVKPTWNTYDRPSFFIFIQQSDLRSSDLSIIGGISAIFSGILAITIDGLSHSESDYNPS